MGANVAGSRATRIASVAAEVMWWVGLSLGAVFLISVVTAPMLRSVGLVPRFSHDAFAVTQGGGPPRVVARVEVPGAVDGVQAPGSDAGEEVDPVLNHTETTTLDAGVESWGRLYVINVLQLPIVAAALWCMFLLRAILRDVRKSAVFTHANGHRLAQLGWIIVGASLAGPHLAYWRASVLLDGLTPTLSGIAPADTVANGKWLIGVFLLVLSSVWQYGLELQDDRDLTV